MFTEHVDLPTPPLPLATAMMRSIPGTRFWFAQGFGPVAACGVAAGIFTCTCASLIPGTALIAASHSPLRDRKSTRLNSSHGYISYAVFCLKKKKKAHLSPYEL